MLLTSDISGEKNLQIKANANFSFQSNIHFDINFSQKSKDLCVYYECQGYQRIIKWTNKTMFIDPSAEPSYLKAYQLKIDRNTSMQRDRRI